MRRFPLVAALVLPLLAACGGGGGSTTPSVPKPEPTFTYPPSSPDNWLQFRYDNQGNSYNSQQSVITKSNVATLAPKWVYQTKAGAFATPIVVNGTVYLAESNGQIDALDENTGKLLWQYVTPVADAFVSTPLYLNGRIYAPSTKDHLYVLDAATGNLIYQSPVITPNGSFESSPIYADGKIFVGQSNSNEDGPPSSCLSQDQVVTIDPQQFVVTASSNLTPQGTYGVGVWSSPVEDAQGSVYLASGNSCSQTSSKYADSIIKYSPSLSMLWHSAGPPDLHDWDFGASPVLVNNLVIDAAKNGEIYAYDQLNGSIAWTTSAGMPLGAAIGSLATDGQNIIVPYNATPDGKAGAIVDIGPSGNLKWTLAAAQDWPGYGPFTPATITQGMAFAAYKEQNCSANCDGISALDVNTGAELWRYTTPAVVLGGISVVNGGVFAAEFQNPSGGPNMLYCFTPGGK